MHLIAVLCIKMDIFSIYHLQRPPSVQSENDQTGTPMFVFVTIPGGITIIMPTIIIIHSSKYSVLFRFISSRCTWIRYSDVQYFPIHVLSRYLFFKMYIHVSSDRLQTYFPSYPCPFECTNYCSFQIYTIEYHPIPASELIALGGEVSLFSIFFSDLMSDVFCIDITPLVL